ncbi:Protein FAM75D1 [Chelonia mydas]|uniref:Protein FAM75D1 n=1 Tax=Chelonia mydas TaxID=8469 RepID=M7APX8_CHEMY|nr:Protein FAM75D1 [Chelonia mydas]
MDEDTRGRLERHLRKMTLQRRWGLPRRIQESLRLFAAFAPPASPQLPGAGGEGGVGRSQLGPSQPDVPAGSRLAGDGRTEGLAAERRDRLQRHLARKCLEIGLGVWPALVKRSQRAAREGERIRLPRLIPAGQKPPTPRAGSLLCLSPTAVDTLDMNVRHKQLAYFWGLPTLQAASLQRMMSKAPAAPLGSAAGRAWMQMSLAGSMGAKKPERNGYKEPPLVTGPPLLTAEARDQLESHILRKKLQHEWGLPRVVQRSLGAFTPPPPGRGPLRWVQAPARGRVAVGSLLFLRTETREHLESHVKRLALERRWGLPKRILESLRMFLPPAPPGAEPRGQTQLLLHVSHKPPQGPTAPSMGQSGELQPSPRETLTHQSQHWHEMGVKEGKASCPVAVPLGSSSRRSQETSQTSDGEGPPGSPCHFPEDKTELKSTLDFPGKKVLGISHRAQASQRWASCPAAHEPHPQQREQGSEESPRRWRTHDGEGAPQLAGTGGRSQTSSVETAVWNEKRISRKLESSFRRMARSRSRHGPVGKQLLSLEIAGHLEMDHCTCLDCPRCKLEGRDGARTLGAGSPVWHTQCICARGSATLPGDTEAPSFLHAEPAWQGQGGPRAAKDEPSASSPSSPEGSESRVSDWSAGESAHTASCPAPDEPSLARVHLAPPRTAAHRLDIHLAQKALGSFILPPCVIRSQATYADMEAERLRAAAQEHRREMNIRLQRRRAQKSQLGGPHQEAVGERAHPMGTGQPGFPTAGSLGQRLIGESQSQANQYLCETCHGLFTTGEEGLSPLPCPAEGAGKSDVGRTQLDTRVCPRDRETSGDVCRGEQGAAYQQPQDLGRAAGTPLYEGLPGPEDGEGAGGQTWAPPTHHPQPVTRDDVGDRGSPAASDELVCTLSSSQWPASPSEQRPRSAEGLSQFSTEGEGEMVGDWDSEAVAAWDTEGAGSLGWKERRNTEGQHSMGEMPAEGTRPRAGTNMRQTEALVLTAALPRAEQPPRAPPGRGAEPPSVPCKGKGPTFRGIMLGFLKRVTSRASVGKREWVDVLSWGKVEWVDVSVAAPRGAPPPPRKLAPSPKSVTFNAKVHVQAEVRRCQLCSSGEEMDGAGRKDPAAAAWSRGLPGNGAPQGAGVASTDTKRGERRRGSVTRGEESSPEGTGPSAEYGGYQERMTLTVTKCREGKAHDHSGTPAVPAGPPAPWPPPPACPATRGTRTTGRHTGEGGGVTSLKAADPRQQGAGRAHGHAIRHVSTAGAFTSSQLDEQMVVIGLILEKKLGLRHGLYAWERSQRRRRALWGPGGRREGAGAECAGDMEDTTEESQLGDGSCVARAHAGAGPAVEGAVRAKRTDVPQGPGTDLPWPPRAENPEPVRGHSSKRLQRQEHSAGVSESGSNQPSPRESSRAKPREQRGWRLSPSPPRGRSRSPVEGPWGSGRARGADSRGIQARSRERRSSSRGRPTGRRTRSKSRQGESLVREGVQDQQGARRRPGKASSHRVAPPASGVGGNATEDASGTVGASHLERRGHQTGVETQLLQPGSRPAKSTGHVCWFHQHHAHAHLRNVHDRTAALRRENLCALREKMQARRRKLSPSLNSAASEEDSCLRALDQS